MIECISRKIKVIDCKNARLEPEIKEIMSFCVCYFAEKI